MAKVTFANKGGSMMFGRVSYLKFPELYIYILLFRRSNSFQTSNPSSLTKLLDETGIHFPCILEPPRGRLCKLVVGTSTQELHEKVLKMKNHGSLIIWLTKNLRLPQVSFFLFSLSIHSFLPFPLPVFLHSILDIINN